MVVDRVEEHLREDLGKRELLHGAEVAAGLARVNRQHAQGEVLVAEQMPELADHLLDTHVRARVARAAVAREQKAQGLARLPLGPRVDGVAVRGELDEGRHGPLQHAVGVDRVGRDAEGLLRGLARETEQASALGLRRDPGNGLDGREGGAVAVAVRVAVSVRAAVSVRVAVRATMAVRAARLLSGLRHGGPSPRRCRRGARRRWGARARVRRGSGTSRPWPTGTGRPRSS